MIGGLATYCLAMIGHAFSSKVIGLIITRVPDAIAIAILGVAVNAIVADLASEENRGKVFGNVSQFSTWGNLIGTTIGFYVAFNVSMETGEAAVPFLRRCRHSICRYRRDSRLRGGW